jgi:hypothetical protein
VFLADTVELESITGSKYSTPIFAGFMTGGLFKCGVGVRGGLLAAVVGTDRCEKILNVHAVIREENFSSRCPHHFSCVH